MGMPYNQGKQPDKGEILSAMYYCLASILPAFIFDKVRLDRALRQQDYRQDRQFTHRSFLSLRGWLANRYASVS